jgi:hypothetical protein
LFGRGPVKVLDSGHRERQALLRWWDVVSDEDVAAGTRSVPPFWRTLEVATYDPILDAILWRDEVKTIAEINAMERKL